MDRPYIFVVSIVLLGMCANEVGAENRFSDRLARLLSSSVRSMDVEIENLENQSQGLPLPELFNRSESLGYHSRRFDTPDEVHWVEVDLKQEQEIDQIAVLPVFVEVPLFEGQNYGFPLRFKIEVIGEDRSDVRIVTDHSSEDYHHTPGYPYTISLAEPIRGRYIRITSLRHSKVYEHWAFAISEIMVLQGPINIAAGCPVNAGPGWSYRMIGWTPDNLTDSQSPLGPPTVPALSPSNGLLCEHAESPEVNKWMQVDLGRLYPVDAIRLLPSRPTDYVDVPGLGFPVRFKIELSSRPEFSNGHLVFDSGSEAYPNPGDNAFELHAQGEEARYIRVMARELSSQGNQYAFSLGELQVYSGGNNVAIGKTVSASDVFENPNFPLWNLAGLVDGYNSQNRLVELPDWLTGLEERRQFSDRLIRLGEEREQRAETIVVRATAGTLAVSGVLVITAIAFAMTYRKRKSRETEELRRQISRDLHDDIGGDLGGILLLSEGVLKQSDLSGETREDLQDIHNIARGSSEALRDIVWLIREERNLEDLLLRLRETAQLALRKLPFTWSVEPERMPTQIVPLNVRRHVFFGFKETITNIRKHSRADQVEVNIKVDSSKQRIDLQVSDNGQGFDPQHNASGYGLRNMQRRCEALNGHCEIVSNPGKGTLIKLTFSLKL